MKKIVAALLAVLMLCTAGCSTYNPNHPGNYSNGVFPPNPAYNKNGENNSSAENVSDGTALNGGENNTDGDNVQNNQAISNNGENADRIPETYNSRTTSTGEKRCVAYFTSWSAYARGADAGDIDPNLLTHINYAFANLNSEGKIIIGDSWVDVEKPFDGDNWETPADSRGLFGQLRRIKQQYPHIKTLISVGGWTWSNNFSATASTEQGRKNFANSAVEFVTKYGFDGLDIDWEFPVEGGNNIPHLPEDKENYTLLLKETREAFDAQSKKDGKQYLLTIAGGPNVSFTENTELAKMMNYLDFINIMTYDYHGGWENVTGHNAPLYTADSSDNYCVSDTVDAYIAAGVKPQDLNLGLAFYGRGWTNVGSDNNGLNQSGTLPGGTGFGCGTWEGGVFDYWDIQENYLNKSGFVRCFDKDSRTPYLYNGTVFITYDDKESITAKLNFADEKGLGGAMFWECYGDKRLELQKLIASYYGFDFSNKSTAEQPKTDDSSKAESSSKPENNTASSKPAEKPQQSGVPNWDAASTYNGGDAVMYNGVKYRAKWWTQGEAPADNEWGAWEKL